jgi:hypothetical protein
MTKTEMSVLDSGTLQSIHLQKSKMISHFRRNFSHSLLLGNWYVNKHIMLFTAFDKAITHAVQDLGLAMSFAGVSDGSRSKSSKSFKPWIRIVTSTLTFLAEFEKDILFLQTP